jgi:mono/diheme cytochrome c family protein
MKNLLTLRSWSASRSWSLRGAVLTASLAAVSTSALAGVDPAKGRQLHDKTCVACHAERYGGDGSKIYLRSNRLVNDRAGLDQRVTMCSALTNAGWLPDDEANVAEYLATRYYKFGAPAAKK